MLRLFAIGYIGGINSNTHLQKPKIELGDNIVNRLRIGFRNIYYKFERYNYLEVFEVADF